MASNFENINFVITLVCRPYYLLTIATYLLFNYSFLQGECVHLCGDEGGVAGVRAGLLQADLPARHAVRQPRRRRHRTRNQPGTQFNSLQD